MKVEAHRDAAEVLEPREQPLDLPAAAVAPQLPPVLRPRLLPVRLVRRDQLDALPSKLRVERVGVISLVADQSFGSLSGKNLGESAFDKGDFMRASRRRVDGERKTRAVCHRRFQQWVREGALRKVLEALAEDLRTRGELDLSECFIDATFIVAKKGDSKWERPSGAKARSSWRWQTALVFLFMTHKHFLMCRSNRNDRWWKLVYPKRCLGNAAPSRHTNGGGEVAPARFMSAQRQIGCPAAHSIPCACDLPARAGCPRPPLP